MSNEVVEGELCCPPTGEARLTQADGKLLVMTPIDPAFLLIPLLRMTVPVSYSSLTLHAPLTLPQADGLGNFRPPEEIIEDAASKLASTSASTSKDPGLTMSSEDVMFLSNLGCVQAAMRRVCEYKGASLLSYHG